MPICPKCGKSNEESASFCLFCGAQLGAVSQSGGVVPTPSPVATQPSTRSPWVPAALNFFFLGAGYYYMGYKKVFQIQTRGFMLAVGVVYIILEVIFASLSVGAVGNLLILLIAIFLAVDGMRKANGQPSWIQAEASPEQHTIGQSVILGLVIGIIVVIISIFV